MNNSTTSSSKAKFDTIPYIDIILPYTTYFLDIIENRCHSLELKDKLQYSLLHELSDAAEIALQNELENFIADGNNSYDTFVEITSLSLAYKYPVLDHILKRIVNNYAAHIQKIYTNFYNDINVLVETFDLKNNGTLFIKDIDTSLGDGHGGESTALITLDDGSKLIYKPRNIETSIAYNSFIEWINKKLDVTLKTIKCLSRDHYGWLEFVAYQAVECKEELKEYYHKAGILLAVTLLLGSKDCHSENVIASGKNPVLIDHETIIQPVLNDHSIRTWDGQHKIPYFSTLESMLIVNRDTGALLECVGFGIEGNIESISYEARFTNHNTIDSKRTTRFITNKHIKNNIPILKEAPVFTNKFKDDFIKGFSSAYDSFINAKEELLGSDSPLTFFDNNTIRYVWRPTFIYFRILKYMRKPEFLTSFETYNTKLYNLMSKAYKKESAKAYKFILNFEMEQMLNGDIPLFDLNSKDYHLGEVKEVQIFKNNCIENIKNRIASLSTKHKNEQIEYIHNWLAIKMLK
ncbi:type 2 lanthipeptide synthetase LanM [Aquimarina brevivitae]|uniref:Type 2 lantibiotic biosynthesis protein LanM n=1 Tax=Aquimarina brevivitae TaxID=323412 RepID=A0A4Q7PG15_9FLAO|nr:type 2 lanthipeptide synthetase LanM [Aquimarina brevivitae]RZS99434.1 type 2 lantibiotic biosynthesis protein LanM [Aquimarina brevivitae]